MRSFDKGMRAGALVVLLIGSMVAGCTVKLVSDYDDQIDSGLSQLNTDITAFVNKMIDAAGTPAGTWASNKDFYIEEDAKLDTMIARAEAHKALNSCPSTQAVAAAIGKTVPQSAVAKYVDQIPQDDCMVTLLKLIEQGVGDVETFHKAQGNAGIPAAAHDPLLVGGVGSLIRSAMTVELALKSGQSIQAGGGH
jgi:hypothetical protein